MTSKVLSMAFFGFTFLLLHGTNGLAENTKSYRLDHAKTLGHSLDSSLPMRVQRFTTDSAALGKAKHQDTARIVRESAAAMLLVDVIEELRSSGFADVAEFDTSESLPEESYVVSGKFTEINPGSQSARVLWGFGAGKSKVCLQGEISSGSGQSMGDFQTCQKSLGWGDSQQQLESEVDRIGVEIANFLVDWSRK